MLLKDVNSVRNVFSGSGCPTSFRKDERNLGRQRSWFLIANKVVRPLSWHCGFLFRRSVGHKCEFNSVQHCVRDSWPITRMADQPYEDAAKTSWFQHLGNAKAENGVANDAIQGFNLPFHPTNPLTATKPRSTPSFIFMIYIIHNYY